MDWKWNTVALCSICNMINSADRIIMPIVIVSMTDKYEWDLHQQGWILSSFAFGYIASQLIGVKASKKYGNKRVLAFAVLAWSLATIITPIISSHLYLLIFCRILIGLGDGLGLPTIFAIFSQRIPIQRRSSAFVYLIAAGHFGQTMSALICPHLEWELAFYLFGGLGLAWLLLWLGTFKEDYVNTSTQDDELPLVEFPDKSRQLRWTKFLWSWPLWAIYIAHFSMNWSNYIIMQWLPTYFVRYLEASKEAVSLTAVPYIVNSLCELAVARSAEWLSARNWPLLSVRKLMTFIGLVGPAIFLILFSIVNSLTFAVIFVSIAMGLCAFNSAGHLSNHTDVVPNHASITFAISNTISTIPGILCGPVTAELVTESHGRWLPVFVIAAGVNCVGAVIYASQSTVSPVYQ